MATEVLVIDDSVDVRTLLAFWLKALGFDVRTADGADAALREVGEHTPDVILLDVRLPGASGFEVCLRLKRNALTRAIPIVMISGLRDLQNEFCAHAVGADKYLVKPFDEGELLAAIGAVLNRTETLR